MFLNVPFDADYAPLFLALIAGLTALGRTPRCVLEVPSGGRNRLERIFGLMESCDASIHDLSRITLSGPQDVPRFNMPFELGMAYALAQKVSHDFFIFEEKPFRLQASLSDLNGHDPHIHDSTPSGVLRCVLDCVGTPSGAQSMAGLEALTRQLVRSALKLQREMRVAVPFHSYVFRRLVLAASEISRHRSLIQ
ncbi:MAG: hypothetical protein ACJ76N_10770 [Thermoanaerobaculia bacterium]